MYSPISHQIGAVSATLFDQIIAFTPVMMHSVAVQKEKTVTPMFQGPLRNALTRSGSKTRMQDRKLTMGTRGYVGSMFLSEWLAT